MPIPINLKQILQSDTQQEKLDKVNYNFDQLVANGGGPMGATGSIGETGFQGATGDDGPQGIDGPQGPQGPADASNNSKWKDGAIWSNGALNIKTITPIHELDDDNSATQSNFPPTGVLLGYANNDDEYGDPNTSLIAGYLDSVLLINKNSNYHDSNIRLISEKGTDKYLDIALTNYTALSSNGEQSVLEFKFASSVAAGEYRWNADRYIINDVNDNEMMSMDATDGVKFTGSFLSTNDAIFTGSIFKINNGTGTQATDPDIDKIAVSLDNTGTIGFKTASEIGASVPIGTIVSFHYETYIDASNFTQTQAIDLNSDPSAVDIVLGRGIAGTQYEGWYLCNGQTWKNSNKQYTVPNLNSFSFNFTTNAGQIASLSSASRPNFLGGGEFEFEQIGNSIEYSIDVNPTGAWVSETALNSNYASTDYTVVKTPQLIYLGASDLYYNVTLPAPISFNLKYTDSKIQSGDSPNFDNINEWEELNNSSSNSAKERTIQSFQVKDDTGNFVNDANVQLAPGQTNVFELRLKAWGKTAITSGGINGIPDNRSNDEKQSYSWFVDWTEKFDGTDLSTSTWNDRGQFSSNTTYNNGDVFHYSGKWYTLAPNLSSVNTSTGAYSAGTSGGAGAGASISNPSQHVVRSGSSWEQGGSFHLNKYRYFYVLPYVQETEPSSWFFPIVNASGGPFGGSMPTLNPPANSRKSLTPRFGNGVGGDWTETNLLDESNNPIYPPLYEQQSTAMPLYHAKGRATWPAEIFLDIQSDFGNDGDGMIQIPIVSRYNYNRINQEYGTSFTAGDFPQYSEPWGYTEGTNHWGTDAGPGQITTDQGSTTVNYLYNGGWDSETTDDVLDQWDYWYTSQNDTEFRRYKTVDFKAVVTPEISNQIYEYLSDNPGSTISIRSAWHADLNDTDSVNEPLDPYDTSTDESDLQYTNWNRQPLGMGYKNTSGILEDQVGDDRSVLPSNSLSGTDSFYIDDYNDGEGEGSAVVNYNISPNSATPVVTSSHQPFTVTVGAPDSNGDGIISLQSTLSCTQGNQMSNPTSFTIGHPDDSNISVQYSGNYTRATCPLTLSMTHNLTNNNPVAQRTIEYTNSSGSRSSITLYPQTGNSICAVPGTLTGLGNDISVNVTTNICV